MIQKIEDEELDNLDIDGYVEDGYDSITATAFEKDITNFLISIVRQAELVTEDFVTTTAFNNHFRKHCIGHNRNRRSTRRMILYDFVDNSQYRNYERTISTKIQDTKYRVGSLRDYDTVIKYMTALFKGNMAVRFCNSCDLHNDEGPIQVSFISFSCDVTTNYRGGNTIDVCVQNDNGRTITLFAVDAHDTQRRLNRIIENYSTYRPSTSFEFNND